MPLPEPDAVLLTTDHLTLADHGGTLVLTLTAGDRGNPIHLPAVSDLHAALDEVDQVRPGVLVLRASGRFFSVGGDLAGFAGADDPGAHLATLARSLHAAVSRLAHADYVVISAVHAAAAGAGFPLALTGDLVVASTAASFTMSYTKVGLSPDGGSTAILVADLGLHRALQLALLNPVLTAARAHELGLVAEVVEPEALDDRVLELAAQLRAGRAAAFAGAKRLLRQAALATVEAQMEAETRSIGDLAGRPGGVEGVQAFLAKRSPDWTRASDG